MSDAIALISQAMQADLAHMRTISNNLANINTSGYKREISTAQARFSLDDNLDDNAGVLAIAQRVGSAAMTSSRDLGQGTLKKVDNNHSIAIQGTGYFMVNAGEQAGYTRRGELMLDQTGRLALLSGETLQGEGGDIRLSPGAFSVLGDGTVMQNGDPVDRIKVVDLAAVGQTRYLGSGLLLADRSPAPVDARSYTVMQGYTEASNVNTLSEMVRMIEITRHFETSSNLMRAYDSILDTSINVIGEF